MPGQDKHSKTEAPTPKKRRKEREKGNVAKSMDLNSVAVLLGGILVLKFMGNELFSGISLFMINIYSTLSNINLTEATVAGYSRSGIIYFLKIISPILGVIMVMGLVSNFGQIGFLFSKKALTPKFSKIWWNSIKFSRICVFYVFV